MTQTKTPHVHHHWIVAWAKGETIQVYRTGGPRCGEWEDVSKPSWNIINTYRIKPAPPVHRWRWVYARIEAPQILEVTCDYFTEDEFYKKYCTLKLIQKIDSTLKIS
jgi:hypothetical protein